MDKRIQLVLNDNCLTVEEKIKQLQGIMEKRNIITTGIQITPDETLYQIGDNLLEMCVYPEDNCGNIRWSYTFVPQEDGTRMLEGEFIEYYPLSNQVKYSAKYSHGVIEKSQTYYLGGNVHMECYYHPDGTLDIEYHYPDDEVAYRLGQESTIVVTCNNEDDQGYIKQFKYITDPNNGVTKQVCVQYTQLERGFRHGVYAEMYDDRSSKIVGSYHQGKMHGNWRRFYPNGQPHYYQDWMNGELEHELTWNMDGYLTEKIFTDQDYYYNNSNGVITEKRTLLTNGNWLVTQYDDRDAPVRNKFEETSDGVIVKHIPSPLDSIDNKINSIKLSCLKPINKLDSILCGGGLKLLNGHPCAEYASNRLSSMNQHACTERRWDDNFNRALDYGIRTIIIDDGVPQNLIHGVLNHAKEYFAGYMVRTMVSMVFPNTMCVTVTVPEHVEYERVVV